MVIIILDKYNKAKFYKYILACLHFENNNN